MIVAAAVSGVVDFRQTQLLDVQWWKRLKILLRGIERDRDFKVHDAKFRYYLSQVARNNLTEDSAQKVQEAAQDAFYDLRGTLRPWDGKSATERYRRDMKDARQAYIDAFGVDPMSSEYKAWEAKALAELKRRETEATNKQTPEQLVLERKKQQAAEKQGRRPK